MAECFPEKLRWCSIEQVCQGVSWVSMEIVGMMGWNYIPQESGFVHGHLGLVSLESNKVDLI